MLGQRNSGLQTQGLLVFLDPRGRRPKLVLCEVPSKLSVSWGSGVHIIDSYAISHQNLTHDSTAWPFGLSSAGWLFCLSLLSWLMHMESLAGHLWIGWFRMTSAEIAHVFMCLILQQDWPWLAHVAAQQGSKSHKRMHKTLSKSQFISCLLLFH